VSRRFLSIYGSAFGLAALTLCVSYFPFAWLLIRYQIWRLGHPNPFVIGPELDALWVSSLTAVIVFWLVMKRAKRKSTQSD
jgi:hypothetical protein